MVDRTDWAWEDRTDNSRVRRTVLGDRNAFVRPSPDYHEVKGNPLTKLNIIDSGDINPVLSQKPIFWGL